MVLSAEENEVFEGEKITEGRKTKTMKRVTNPRIKKKKSHSESASFWKKRRGNLGKGLPYGKKTETGPEHTMIDHYKQGKSGHPWCRKGGVLSDIGNWEKQK